MESEQEAILEVLQVGLIVTMEPLEMISVYDFSNGEIFVILGVIHQEMPWTFYIKEIFKDITE